jgi:hypothetical protein
VSTGTYDAERGVLRFPHPDGEVVLPVLTGVALARWNRDHAAAAMRLLDQTAEAVLKVRPKELLEAWQDHMDAIVDLLLVYDESGALGGREQLESRWDGRQAYSLLGLIVQTHGRQ